LQENDWFSSELKLAYTKPIDTRIAPNMKIMNHIGPELENDRVLTEPLDLTPPIRSKIAKDIVEYRKATKRKQHSRIDSLLRDGVSYQSELNETQRGLRKLGHELE
jgi:hypothetical protein